MKRLGGITCLVALVLACDAGDGQQCVPGAMYPCMCTGGGTGYRTCPVDGGATGRCMCSSDGGIPELDAASCMQTTCGDLCVDTMVNRDNCGRCGNVCASGTICTGGTCAASCSATQSNCAGSCADLRTDPRNCGSCGIACPAGQACRSGACQVTCPSGSTACAGRCVALASDPANCGACGSACTATQRCNLGVCMAMGATVTVEWSYPSLVAAPSGEQWLPTYLVHLFGSSPPVMAPPSIGLDAVCASVMNRGSAAQRVDLTVRLPGFGVDAMRSIMVGAGATASTCLNPGWNMDMIYSLRSFAPATFEAYASVSGTEVSRTMRTISMTPSNGIMWTLGMDDPRMGPGLAAGTMATVFSTPNDSTVLSLRAAVEARSMFPGGFGAVSWDRTAARYSQAASTYERTLTLPPNVAGGEQLFLEPGETHTFLISSVTGGNSTVDVMLFSSVADYTSWIRTGSPAPLMAWPGRSAGAADAFVGGPTGGWYALALLNRGATSASISWRRSNSRWDVAFDVLQAIFLELRARGLSYVNISTAYYEGVQLIRRPAESIAMRAANCIDGALLFASIIETIGMEPVLRLVSGHAFVGIRSAPRASGIGLVWPIETTMVGGTNTPFAAMACGLTSCVVPSPPVDRTIEIAEARANRIRSLPR